MLKGKIPSHVFDMLEKGEVVAIICHPTKYSEYRIEKEKNRCYTLIDNLTNNIIMSNSTLKEIGEYKLCY